MRPDGTCVGAAEHTFSLTSSVSGNKFTSSTRFSGRSENRLLKEPNFWPIVNITFTFFFFLTPLDFYCAPKISNETWWHNQNKLLSDKLIGFTGFFFLRFFFWVNCKFDLQRCQMSELMNLKWNVVEMKMKDLIKGRIKSRVYIIILILFVNITVF